MLKDWFYKETAKIKQDALILSLIFVLQFLVWFFISQKIKPDFTITPLPPTRIEMDIASLGDSEFAYRAYSQILQNAGDTFGETIPLKDYNFAKLEKWFYALDELNKDSEYVPSIAAFYYGQSQNVSDCEYIIRYLDKHADFNPNKQWRWYLESVYLAAYRMENYDLAKPIAAKLIEIKNPNMPLWAKTIVPFIMQRKGDLCDAYDLILQLDKTDFKNISEDEILSTQGGTHNPVSKVILDKIEMLKNNPQAIAKCRNRKK
jgi:tetratricopeptide (TPR) repeat protein